MNILAVGAHPDDLETLCAGTLAKYVKEGHKVFMANLCNGNLGHSEISPEELREIRRKECEKAASMIEAELLTPDIGDMSLFPDRETRKKVVDIVRMAKPDVVLTHAPNDYMVDHITTSQLVLDASFAAPVPHFYTDHAPHTKIAPVFYMDTISGIDFQPEIYVDISPEIELKKKMLACHQSQAKWLKEHHNIDYLEVMVTVAKFRGLQCGVAYAEGFRAVKLAGRNVTERLLP